MPLIQLSVVLARQVLQQHRFILERGAMLFALSSYSIRTTPQYLISNKISLPADGMEFEMWHRKYSSSYPETFQIGVSTTDTLDASFTWGDEISSSIEWTKYVQTLAAYAGQDVYIAIKIQLITPLGIICILMI